MEEIENEAKRKERNENGSKGVDYSDSVDALGFPPSTLVSTSTAINPLCSPPPSSHLNHPLFHPFLSHQICHLISHHLHLISSLIHPAPHGLPPLSPLAYLRCFRRRQAGGAAIPASVAHGGATISVRNGLFVRRRHRHLVVHLLHHRHR